MENIELTTFRQEKIDQLTTLLAKHQDGINIIGDGTEILHHELIPLKHSFADGVYIRQMDMPQDHLIIGAVHKDLHVWFLLKGNLTIATKDSVEDFEAPCYVVANPGTQRLIYANEDSIFVNIHKNPSELRDIRKLEEEFCCINMNEYNKQLKQ